MARKMGITGTTLMAWNAKWEKNHLAVARRDRAQEEVGAEEKHAVIPVDPLRRAVGGAAGP